MKPKFIILGLLIACFAQGANKTTATEDQAITETKAVVKQFIQGCEKGNFNEVLKISLNYPDYIYCYNGQSSDYVQMEKSARSLFDALVNQECTMISEKYTVLSPDLVLYTSQSKWLMNFKDGSALLQYPWTMQMLFKKVSGEWKLISGNESGTEQPVINSKIHKNLDQKALNKQLTGTWKGESGKDTTLIMTVEPYGTGLICNYKYSSKGKTVSEGKQQWGYNQKFDRFVIAQMFKGKNSQLFVSWFIEKNRFVSVPYDAMNFPNQAKYKWITEFKSPNEFTYTTFWDNKQTKVITFTRIK